MWPRSQEDFRLSSSHSLNASGSSRKGMKQTTYGQKNEEEKTNMWL
jgi:hypothetical protein